MMSKNFFPMTTIAALSCLVLVSFLVNDRPARAQDAVVTNRVNTFSSVVLPVDQKLLDVEWLCRNPTCEPWFLTRVMSRKDRATSHVFTDRSRTVVVTETRDDGYWKWERTDIIELPPMRRLIGVKWRCATPDGCEPWFLTRILRDDEEARAYTFMSTRQAIFVRESPGVH